MKKLVVLILASLFVANVAMAVVDPDDNQMGIYFDMNADVFEFETAPYVSVNAYVMLTNPTADAVFGYEFHHIIEGGFLAGAVVYNGPSPIPVGATEGVLVGLGGPLGTSPATLLATIGVIPLGTDPIAFTLKGVTPNSVAGSATPAVLLAGSEIMATGLSAGFDEMGNANVCAYVNGTGVVATDDVSIDAVKALYR